MSQSFKTGAENPQHLITRCTGPSVRRLLAARNLPVFCKTSTSLINKSRVFGLNRQRFGGKIKARYRTIVCLYSGVYPSVSEKGAPADSADYLPGLAPLPVSMGRANCLPDRTASCVERREDGEGYFLLAV
ncbi:hypothetical protein BaRGS_00026174 [Batillaria attramentaria]|uniref:Uncharacterized protein n=1 Tax=Batillaria attramentaria TaxID=370345 RepID=A0ABD0K6T5_9CAEN